MMRPTKATVRLDALRQNLETAARLAPGARNLAVVKANAYGHGAVEVARALEPRVPALAVAVIDEAVQLREAGIGCPIMVLQGPTGREDVREAAARDYWLMLHDQGQVSAVLEARLEQPVTAWLKVDTGMHRLGMEIAEAPAACQALSDSGSVRAPVVLCTHLACADEPDHPATRRQLTRFRAFAEGFELPGSIANSAGIMFWPESHAEWNRPGYMLYGNSPSTRFEGTPASLTPVMTLSSGISAVRRLARGEGVGYGQRWVAERPSVVGTIPIGYGDGYPRHAPSGTPVLVRGRRAPLAGTVSMDIITVDLTDLGQARVGDPVELWGENLSVNEVASSAGTIGYELLAGLTARVPRVYR